MDDSPGRSRCRESTGTWVQGGGSEPQKGVFLLFLP